MSLVRMVSMVSLVKMVMCMHLQLNVSSSTYDCGCTVNGGIYHYDSNTSIIIIIIIITSVMQR